MFNLNRILRRITQRRFIIVLVLIALAVRLIVGMFYYAPDSILYLELAEQIQEGKLYLENFWDESIIGEKVFLSPLYSACITLAQPLVDNWVWSGIIISLLFNCASIVILYFFIRKLLSETTARVTAIIFTLFPLFVKYSTLILTESLFTFLIIVAAFIAWRLFEKHKPPWQFLLLGLLVGTSFLARTTGLVGAGAIGIWILYLLFKHRSAYQYYMKIGIAFTIGVMVLIVLYVGYLYVHTDQILISGQQDAVSNFTNLPRVGINSTNEDHNIRWATLYSLNEKNELIVFDDSLSDSSLNITYMLANLGDMFLMLFFCSSPFIIILALSLVGKERCRILDRRTAFFSLWIIITLLFYSMGKVNLRYLLPVLFIVVMFGTYMMEYWIVSWTVKKVQRGLFWGAYCVIVILFLFMASYVFNDVFPPGQRMYTYLNGYYHGVAITEAISWAENNIAPGSTIMASSGIYSHYIESGKFEVLPNADAESLEAYLRVHPVDYIIVDSYFEMPTRPEISFVFFGGLDPRRHSDTMAGLPHFFSTVTVQDFTLEQYFVGEFSETFHELGDEEEECLRYVVIYRYTGN